MFHQTAHHGPEAELRGDTLILRGLRLESARLHLHGVSDVVEFHRSPDGVALHGREELWLPYPVEYKKGSDKTQDADEVQLCAQALCLEEMLCCAIPEGSLFYGEPAGGRGSRWMNLSVCERCRFWRNCWRIRRADIRHPFGRTRAAMPARSRMYAFRGSAEPAASAPTCTPVLRRIRHEKDAEYAVRDDGRRVLVARKREYRRPCGRGKARAVSPADAGGHSDFLLQRRKSSTHGCLRRARYWADVSDAARAIFSARLRQRARQCSAAPRAVSARRQPIRQLPDCTEFHLRQGIQSALGAGAYHP